MDSPFSPQKPRPPGARKARKNAPRPEDRASVINGYFKTFDGTKLFYSIEGKGRPMVFCYGLVCSSLHWTYQIEHFKRNNQAIWFDYRGHQNSEVPSDLKSLTIQNIATDLGHLLDELKIEKPIILGHSMGVNVVLDFYRQQPDRVAAMVLANGTIKRPLETIFRNNASLGVFHALKKAYETSPRLFAKLWDLQKGNPLSRMLVSLGGFNPYLTPREDVDHYISEVERMDPGILLRLLERYQAYDATPWLHTIQVPTLIVAGEQDNITPLEEQELMHQLIPNSQLEVIHHGSHCPQMDLPELVNVKIEKFLAQVSEPSPTMETASQSTD